MAAEEGWVRALWPGEASKEMAQAKHRHQITCYRLGLCSARPLTHHLIRSALSALYRTCPHLRLRIVDRDGALWFREMKEELVQLAVSSSVDVDGEIERQITTPFESSTGPLWRSLWFPRVGSDKRTANYDDASGGNVIGVCNSNDNPNSSDARATGDTLMPSDKELTSGESSQLVTDADSHWVEEIADKFPYTSTLLMTFHHAITDGFTSLKTCAQLVYLLDQIAKGCTNPDCSKQIGEFSDGSETMRLLQERKDFLDKDPKMKEMVERSVGAISDFRPMFTEAFPIAPEQQRNATLGLVRSFTRDQTNKLLSFFREEKITFNSGFLAMVNLSLVEMLKKRGFKQRVFEISSYTATNLRRYWKGDTSRALGCHAGPISLLTDTAATSIHQFLEYAHDVQTNMLDYISQKRTIDERLFLDIKKGTNCSNLDELYASPPEHPQYWYSLTNMGNASSLIASEGESVQLGWFSRHLSFHRYNSTIIFAFHTFRDRLCYTLGYNARTVTEEVAQELSDHLNKLMLDIVRQMS